MLILLDDGKKEPRVTTVTCQIYKWPNMYTHPHIICGLCGGVKYEMKTETCKGEIISGISPQAAGRRLIIKKIKNK